MESLVLLSLFILAFGVIAIFFKKKRDGRYDEMQKMIRAEAYKRGYLVTICLIVVILVMHSLEINIPVDIDFMLYGILMAGVVVFSVYNIINGAFFSMNQRGTCYIVLLSMAILSNIICAVKHIMDGTMFAGGTFKYENGGLAIIFSIGFLIILIAIMYRKLKPEN